MSELKNKFITECLNILDRNDVKDHFKDLMKPFPKKVNKATLMGRSAFPPSPERGGSR